MPAITYPRPLSPGDKVAILSPASIIRPDYVEGAVSTLKAWGLTPVVMPHTLLADGTYSGTAEQRIADLREAFTNPDIRAILCSRGGYGTVHLLPQLAQLPLARDPKWVIGFSDISALHALMSSRGVVSVHASMAKQLTLGGPDHPLNRQLLSLLTGSADPQQWPTHPCSRQGQATAQLVGGNLAVLGGLIGSTFSPFRPDTILFIEDIAEPIYKVERILWQLRLMGVLDHLAGLIVGRFTDYRPDANHPDMEQMISSMVANAPYPVAIGAPIGHIDENIPLLHGATATLRVESHTTTLSYIK